MANKQKQMLAVWGSPGAGKTVTAVKLAAELAKRKKNVVLVFTDLTAPSLPAVAAEGKLPEVSVGDLLSAPGIPDNLSPRIHAAHVCVTRRADCQRCRQKIAVATFLPAERNV